MEINLTNLWRLYRWHFDASTSGLWNNAGTLGEEEEEEKEKEGI